VSSAATLVLLGNQVRNEANVYFASYSDFRAEKVYWTHLKLEDSNTLSVQVIPDTIANTLTTHGGAEAKECNVVICIRKVIQRRDDNPDYENAQIEALMKLQEDFGDYFKYRRLRTSLVNATCTKQTIKFPYVEEALEFWSQYAGFLTLTFAVRRGAS